MTELGRDARALVSRVKRRDGPSEADRARLRSRLEPIWAVAHGADAIAAVPELVPRVAQGWLSWVCGLLVMSLGFVAPEVPRPIAAAAELAAAKPTPGPTGQAADLLAAARSGAPEAPGVRQQPAVASELEPPQSRANRLAERRSRPRPVHKVAPPVAASTVVAASSALQLPAASTVNATPAPAAPRDLPAPISAGPARPSSIAAGESVPSRGSELAPNVRSRAFAPQPIDDELTWLGAAQEALHNHQPSAALRLVQEHAFRFPQGALASERVAVHALALCALSRKEAARAVLSELEQRAPNSPLLAHVRRNCGF